MNKGMTQSCVCIQPVHGEDASNRVCSKLIIEARTEAPSRCTSLNSALLMSPSSSATVFRFGTVLGVHATPHIRPGYERLSSEQTNFRPRADKDFS